MTFSDGRTMSNPGGRTRFAIAILVRQCDNPRRGRQVQLLAAKEAPMTTPTPQDVTQLLDAVSAGDSRAAGELLPLVYDQLRKLARARMSREKAGATLQPTALVHEAYLRLVGDHDVRWENRGHFF